MLPSPFLYCRPESLEAALAVLEDRGDGATPYAGGTELLLLLKMRLAEYDALVDLKRIPELRDISLIDGVLRVGAMATHATIAAHADVRREAPALAELCGSIANPRVRASGTIGGNLCFAEPTADPPVLLAALDATLHLSSVRDVRRVPADGFVTGPMETERVDGEILVRIEIPTDGPPTRYVRQLDGHRSLVGAAASIPVEAGAPARVRLGCLAERPVCLSDTESRIAESPSTLDLGALRVAVAGDIAAHDPADEADSSTEYRRHVAAVVTLRAVAAAARAAGREVRE